MVLFVLLVLFVFFWTWPGVRGVGEGERSVRDILGGGRRGGAGGGGGRCVWEVIPGRGRGRALAGLDVRVPPAGRRRQDQRAARLVAMGLPKSGTKPELSQRLLAAGPLPEGARAASAALARPGRVRAAYNGGRPHDLAERQTTPPLLRTEIGHGPEGYQLQTAGTLGAARRTGRS